MGTESKLAGRHSTFCSLDKVEFDASSRGVRMKALDAARLSQNTGAMPREEYWGLIRGAIANASELSGCLAQSGSNLTISEVGLVLNYPIDSNASIRFIVDGSDTRSIGVSVIADGRYERLLQESLLAISRHCSAFADIGANVGFYSIAVRRTNPSCEVIAFECNPKVRELFTQNIELNSLDGILLHSEALSDRHEEVLFYVPPFTGSSGGSFRDLHPEEGEAQKFNVKTAPLDSFAIDALDLMKIDVEGAELGVILGGMATIKGSYPTIFIELLRKWMKPFGSSPKHVSDLLKGLGYLVFEVKEDWILEVDDVSSETAATNFVFVHETRLNHLDIIRGLVASGS